MAVGHVATKLTVSLMTTTWLFAVLLGACGAAQLSPTTNEGASEVDAVTVEAHRGEVTTEKAPLPADLQGNLAVGRQVPCRPVEPTAEVHQDVAHFRRWLRDQSVGRQVSVEQVGPVCPVPEAIVVTLTLQGPAGGLQSMGRALQAYYPSSEWKVRQYERLQGDHVPLRVSVEVTLRRGVRPRPRCEWDPNLSCP